MKKGNNFHRIEDRGDRGQIDRLQTILTYTYVRHSRFHLFSNVSQRHSSTLRITYESRIAMHRAMHSSFARSYERLRVSERKKEIEKDPTTGKINGLRIFLKSLWVLLGIGTICREQNRVRVNENNITSDQNQNL